MTDDQGGELVKFEKPKQKHQRKQDWNAAWAYFISDPQITLMQVSRNCGINKGAVYRHAHANNWQDRKEQIIKDAGVQIEQMATKTLTDRMRDTILVADGLRRVAIEGIKENKIEPKDAASMIPSYVKLERLIGGESTENVLHAIPKIDVSLLTDEEVDTLVYLLAKARGQETA